MSCFRKGDDDKECDGFWCFFVSLNPFTYCWWPTEREEPEKNDKEDVVEVIVPIGPMSPGSCKTSAEVKLQFLEKPEETDISPPLETPDFPKLSQKDMVQHKRVAERMMLYWNTYKTRMPDIWEDRTPPEMVEKLNFILKERMRLKNERRIKNLRDTYMLLQNSAKSEPDINLKGGPAPIFPEFLCKKKKITEPAAIQNPINKNDRTVVLPTLIGALKKCTTEKSCKATSAPRPAQEIQNVADKITLKTILSEESSPQRAPDLSVEITAQKAHGISAGVVAGKALLLSEDVSAEDASVL